MVPRKDYGIGWSFPTCWQGWLTTLAYFAALLAMPWVGQRWGHPAAMLLAGTATAGLLIVLLVKGEPLRKRSGGERAPGSPARALRVCRISSYAIATVFLLQSIPLALRRVPRNPWYGFRVGSTLAGSPAHWFRVNEIAGLAGVIAALIALSITALLARRRGPPSLWRGRGMLLLTLALIAAAEVIPFLAA